MTKSTCIEPECARPIQARKMCSTHYSYWHRANRTHPTECKGCGKIFNAPRAGQNFCSHPCANRYHAPIAQTHPNTLASRAARKAPTPRPAPPEWLPPLRVHGPKGDRRGPLRRAYEDGDMVALLEIIKGMCELTASGCWEWRRKIKDGYGVVIMGGRQHSVHRLTAMARYGQSESEPVIHHACTNRACCNPAHLQPISQRENQAEMLERNYYIKRIAELEDALRRVNPDNPILAR